MTRRLNTILLVEDDPDIQEVAAMALEDIGAYTVRVCSSGKAAVEAAPGVAPDLVLLDVMMPEMDGPETLKALRRIPETASIPVVFLTAKSQPHEIAAYRDLGVADVIGKPFDPFQLCQDIHEIWTRCHD